MTSNDNDIERYAVIGQLEHKHTRTLYHAASTRHPPYFCVYLLLSAHHKRID